MESERHGGEKMKEIKETVLKMDGATIIIYRPTVPEEEKERILKRIAQIKATW